jgi:hypothetical protein
MFFRICIFGGGLRVPVHYRYSAVTLRPGSAAISGRLAWSVINISYLLTRNALMRQYVVLSGYGIKYCFPQIAFQ